MANTIEGRVVPGDSLSQPPLSSPSPSPAPVQAPTIERVVYEYGYRHVKQVGADGEVEWSRKRVLPPKYGLAKKRKPVCGS